MLVILSREMKRKIRIETDSFSTVDEFKTYGTNLIHNEHLNMCDIGVYLYKLCKKKNCKFDENMV